jgi:hypothetical protein
MLFSHQKMHKLLLESWAIIQLMEELGPEFTQFNKKHRVSIASGNNEAYIHDIDDLFKFYVDRGDVSALFQILNIYKNNISTEAKKSFLKHFESFINSIPDVELTQNSKKYRSIINKLNIFTKENPDTMPLSPNMLERLKYIKELLGMGIKVPSLNIYDQSVASSMTGKEIEVSPKPEETYKEWLVRAYFTEFSQGVENPRKLKKLQKQAERQADKQEKNHGKLLEILRRYVPIESLVVSPASGFLHEAHFAPEYRWLGLEYQENLVNKSNTTIRQFNELEAQKPLDEQNIIHAEVQQWDVFSDPLPKGDAVYIKHFCGGGTDVTIQKAIEKNYKYIIIATCCTHRFTDKTYEYTFKGKIDKEDFEKLAHISTKKGTEEAKEAQQIIDREREKVLEDEGYNIVERGWFKDERGDDMPNGGYLVAIR